MKKCPRGMLSEVKYDGERVQVHKKGNEFRYFSRSLKPVLAHKVNTYPGSPVRGFQISCTAIRVRSPSFQVNLFKDYIPKAFPDGDDLILDSEVLMIDSTTGQPLPFGSLGIHKVRTPTNSLPRLPLIFNLFFLFAESGISGCQRLSVRLRLYLLQRGCFAAQVSRGHLFVLLGIHGNKERSIYFSQIYGGTEGNSNEEDDGDTQQNNAVRGSGSSSKSLHGCIPPILRYRYQSLVQQRSFQNPQDLARMIAKVFKLGLEGLVLKDMHVRIIPYVLLVRC